VRLWDAATGRQVHQLVGLAQLKDQGWRERLLGDVVDLAFSPDGTRLLAWSQDKRGQIPGPDGKKAPAPFTPVRLWDHAAGREALALNGLTQHPVAAAFSPDGRHVLTVGLSQKINIDVDEQGGKLEWGAVEARDREQLWDAATGKHLGHFGPDDLVAMAIWSPDNRRAYLIGKNGGQIWDALAGKRLADLEGIAMSRAALSPDGKRLVGYWHFFDNNRLGAVVWDADTGKKRAALDGHEQEILTAAFSRDSRVIVTASADSTVRVWDAAGGKALHVLRSHRGPVRSAAFSADGRWLATASDDGTARIWDAETWTEWLTLAGHGGPVYAAEFSADTQQIVTASRDGTARVWPVDPLPVARQRRPRDLSDAERHRFDVR
jgi:WD40 repeat protein